MAHKVDTAFTLIGGPTLLIEIGNVRFLTDPTFDPPREYELPGRTLIKQVGPAIAADALPPIDVILLTHDQHRDNLDETGRSLLDKASAVVTTASGAQRLGNGAVGLPAGETTRLSVHGRDVRITATPARHGPPGSEPIVGDVIGFLVDVDSHPTLYVSGDTVLYDGLDAITEYGSPAIGVLHMGRASTRGMLLTMDAGEAASLAQKLRLQHVVPVHYEGWAHFTQSADEAKAQFAQSRFDGEVHWLRHGECYSISSR